MQFRLIAAVLFFIHFNPATAQQEFSAGADSIAFKKGDEAFSLAIKNTDSALLLANEALSQATVLKSNRAIANAWNAMGWIMMHKGFLDSSVSCLQKALQLSATNEQEEDIIRFCINISEVYVKQNRIYLAIGHLMRADSLCIKTGNTVFHTNVWRQLAIVYRESGDYKKSAGYFNKALEGFALLQDHFRFINTGVSLSILYRKEKMMDSSLAILNRCLITAKEKTNLPYQIAMVEEHIAETYYNLDRFDDALQHYMIAYKIFDNLKNRADLAFESYSIGKTLVKLRRFTEAEFYLERSYAISDTLKMLNYQLDASLELASLYEKTSNWRKGFYYQQKAYLLKDSIDMADQIRQTAELTEKFETAKKENEIMLLKAQNQLSQSGHRKTRLLQYIFIILFIASLIIGWLLLNRARIKRKLNEQLLRNQIAGDLHDDIGSALSVIDISSRIALVKQEDRAGMTEQLTRIQQYASKTMDSMSDIVWSVNPVNDNFESVLVRIKEFAAEVCEPLGILLEFRVTGEPGSCQLDVDKRKNIFLICKEAINNAAKYSACRAITVGIEIIHNEMVLITITDDGKGFDGDTVKKGNGLMNMKARALHLKAKLVIRSSETNRGTSVSLACPLR